MGHNRKKGKQSFTKAFSTRKSAVLGCAAFVGLNHALLQTKR